jgi:hypothetical protein
MGIFGGLIGSALSQLLPFQVGGPVKKMKRGGKVGRPKKAKQAKGKRKARK